MCLSQTIRDLRDQLSKAEENCLSYQSMCAKLTRQSAEQEASYQGDRIVGEGGRTSAGEGRGCSHASRDTHVILMYTL